MALRYSVFWFLIDDESDCSDEVGDEEDEIEDDNTEDEIEDDNTDAQGKHIYADQAYMRQMAKGRAII